MNKNRKPSILILGLVLIILSIVIFDFTNNKTRYEKDGIKVEATVTEINGIIRHKNCKVTYVNYAGYKVNANATINTLDVDEGDIITGYYFKDNPNHVYCPSDDIAYSIYGILAFILLIGVYCIITFVKG